MRPNHTSLFLFVLVSLALGGSIPKPVETKTWVVRATTRSSVPSADYILDAVECLRQAISVYNVSDEVAKFYAELFTQKHPSYQWNVVAGYNTIFLNMDYYVETVLTSSDSIFKDKEKSSSSDVKFIIFAAKAHNCTNVAPMV